LSQVITFQRFWMRRGTESEWSAANPTLHAGEIGVAQDPGASPTDITKFKIGDGVRAWNALPWCGIGGLEDLGYNAVPYWNTGTNNYELKHSLPAGVGGTGQTNYNVGEILYASGAAALSRLAPGTLSHVLTTGGPGVAPYWAAIPGSGSGFTFLGTATVSGAAATTLTLSGLDLSAYKAWFVTIALENATGSTASVSLYYNADTTATNYREQALTGNGTSASAGRANDGIVIALTANETSTGTFIIQKDRDGKARCISCQNRGAPAAIIMQFIAHMWDSATNPTGMTLSSSVSNSLAIGSTYSVWGIN
jgi:hypothetical protein